MTTQTPQYGFPVEVTSDAPGTTLREPGSLAQAVEDEIERIDAAIAAPQRSPDVFTSSDTWTNPDDGFRAVKVRMVGGGGAGGGAETVGAGEASVRSGGGAGEYA